MKVAATLMVLALLQGRTLYEDATRSIRVYGYSEAEGGTLENGDFEFKMGGTPATVESRFEGFKISGLNFTGTIGAATAETRAFVRALDVQSQVVAILDSQSRYETQLEHSNRFGTPAPKPPSSKDVATIRADRMTFAGTAASGNFAIPSAFTIESVSSGKQGEASFSQTLTASGSGAAFVVNPNPGGAIPIESGSISGPVKVEISRKETAPGKPESQTLMDGIADRVELNLKSERTITLIGNVRIHGESGAYVGTSEGDTVVITLDESLKPVRIKITGSPLKSTLRDRSSGGGR
jgi:hypothetical protein